MIRRDDNEGSIVKIDRFQLGNQVSQQRVDKGDLKKMAPVPLVHQ